MATYVTADPITKVITITKPPVGGEVVIDVRRDIYSALKVDWLQDDSLNKFKFPISPLGGNPLTGSLSVGAFYFLEYGWRIRPYEADHDLVLDGNLFVREGGRVDVPTLGSYQVSVRQFLSALAYAVSTDPGNIASAVWDAQRPDHVVVNSFGEKVGRRMTIADEGDGISRESD